MKDLGDRLEGNLKDLQRLHLLQSTLTSLQDKFDLSTLNPVDGATFDSHDDEEHNARCLAGTRMVFPRNVYVHLLASHCLLLSAAAA